MTDPDFCILGVDPGVSGAVAFYFPARPTLIYAADVPVAGGDIDGAALAREIAKMAPALAVVELVGAMPGQGVSSTFKFGAAFGTAKGVIQALNVPMHLVAPGRWKRHFRLASDKEMARALAIQLWPGSRHFERKKDHGRAEAAVLARYGAEALPGGAR